MGFCPVRRARRALAVPGDELLAGVEANRRIKDDERVIGEALVGGGVRNDEELILENRVRAERDLSVRLSLVHANGRLEPLAVGVHQTDERDRRAADVRGERRQVVEGLLRLRVEDFVAAERFEVGKLVRRGFPGAWLVCPIGSAGATFERLRR